MSEYSVVCVIWFLNLEMVIPGFWEAQARFPNPREGMVGIKINIKNWRRCSLVFGKATQVQGGTLRWEWSHED